MSTLLVTGGAGFIGSAIVRSARQAGWNVRVLDSLRADVHTGQMAPPTDVDFVRGDVRNSDDVEAALVGVDVVCHQAAKVGLGVDFSDAPDYVDSNVTGTACVLAGMRRAGIRALVLASSMVVYGEGAYVSADTGARVRPAARTRADLDRGIFDPRDGDSGALLKPALVDEDDAVDPRNVYATTKYAQELLAGQWARECGGVAALLRYHNVYGPGMPRDTPYAGVASLFRSAIERGERPRVFEDGAQRRDFVHVDDVAAANLAAVSWTAAQDAGTSRAFNVASGTVTTVLEMATALSGVLGSQAPVVTGEYRVGDVRHITASSRRARHELAWEPRIPFDAGIREFATARLRD